MATSIDSLSAADQADFQQRLTIFGLDTSAMLQPDLVVPGPVLIDSFGEQSSKFSPPVTFSLSGCQYWTNKQTWDVTT